MRELTGLLVIAGVTAGVLSACQSGTGPLAGFSYSAVRPGCGATDGPATDLYLAAQPIAAAAVPPYVVLHVEQPLTAVAGQTYTNISGGYVSGSGVSPVDSGQITFESVNADSTVSGRVDAQFPVVGRVQGSFRAPILPQIGLCG